MYLSENNFVDSKALWRECVAARWPDVSETPKLENLTAQRQYWRSQWRAFTYLSSLGWQVDEHVPRFIASDALWEDQISRHSFIKKHRYYCLEADRREAFQRFWGNLSAKDIAYERQRQFQLRETSETFGTNEGSSEPICSGAAPQPEPTAIKPETLMAQTTGHRVKAEPQEEGSKHMCSSTSTLILPQPPCSDAEMKLGEIKQEHKPLVPEHTLLPSPSTSPEPGRSQTHRAVIKQETETTSQRCSSSISSDPRRSQVQNIAIKQEPRPSLKAYAAPTTGELKREPSATLGSIVLEPHN